MTGAEGSRGTMGFPIIPNNLLMFEKALEASLTQFDTHGTTHLYRVACARMKSVVPIGLETYDIMLKFDLKETQCLKNSGQNAQQCNFKAGFFVETYNCSSRVLMATSTLVTSLHCNSRSNGVRELGDHGSWGDQGS
ncbi:unnamed protein product [Merluccius merluccius]